MAKKKSNRVLEKVIEKDILTYLKFLPKCFAWKNNSTGVFDPSRNTFRSNKNPFVIRGVSDILGIYHGRLLAIEVKRDRTSKPTKEQRDFIKRVKKEGGIAGVCCTVEEARQLIKSSGGGHVNNTKAVSE